MDRSTASDDRARRKRLQQIHRLAVVCVTLLEKELHRLPNSPDDKLDNLLGSPLREAAAQFDRPIVDMTAMTVVWRGERCSLGHTVLLDLMDCLARNPNRWMSYKHLSEEAWDGQVVSDDAIKMAIKRLRGKLTAHGMAELAASIRVAGLRVGYFPDGLAE